MLLLCIAYYVCAQSVFKWIDSEGNTHYADHPPKETPSKAQEKKYIFHSDSTPNTDSKNKSSESNMIHAKKAISDSRSLEYHFASYLDTWAKKLECVGSKYIRFKLPKEKNSLSLVVRLRVLETGDIDNVAILRSSGNDVFDKYALEIAKRASPFKPFPEALRAETNVMQTIKLWTIYRNNQKDSQLKSKKEFPLEC